MSLGTSLSLLPGLTAALTVRHTVAAERALPGTPSPRPLQTALWFPPGACRPSRTERSAATLSPAKKRTTSVRGFGGAAGIWGVAGVGGGAGPPGWGCVHAAGWLWALGSNALGVGPGRSLGSSRPPSLLRWVQPPMALSPSPLSPCRHHTTVAYSTLEVTEKLRLQPAPSDQGPAIRTRSRAPRPPPSPCTHSHHRGWALGTPDSC